MGTVFLLQLFFKSASIFHLLQSFLFACVGPWTGRLTFGKVFSISSFWWAFSIKWSPPTGQQKPSRWRWLKHWPWYRFWTTSYLHAGSHLLYFGQRWGSPFIPCLHWMARQALGLGWQVARGICYTSMNFCDLLEWLSLPGYQGWPFLAWSCQLMWLSLEHRLGLLSKGSQFSLLPFWISTGIQS